MIGASSTVPIRPIHAKRGEPHPGHLAPDGGIEHPQHDAPEGEGTAEQARERDPLAQKNDGQEKREWHAQLTGDGERGEVGAHLQREVDRNQEQGTADQPEPQHGPHPAPDDAKKWQADQQHNGLTEERGGERGGGDHRHLHRYDVETPEQIDHCGRRQIASVHAMMGFVVRRHCAASQHLPGRYATRIAPPACLAGVAGR
jgi:hypothetical protein